MYNHDPHFEITSLKKELKEIKGILENLTNGNQNKEDLWDNSDMMRSFKISERTLADWRKFGLIQYVKVNGKIWYTRKAIDQFINVNTKDHCHER